MNTPRKYFKSDRATATLLVAYVAARADKLSYDFTYTNELARICTVKTVSPKSLDGLCVDLWKNPKQLQIIGRNQYLMQGVLQFYRQSRNSMVNMSYTFPSEEHRRNPNHRSIEDLIPYVSRYTKLRSSNRVLRVYKFVSSVT